MTSLTPKQLETARYVRDYCAEHGGLGPTYREIADHCRRSIPTIFGRIQELVTKGVLEQIGGANATRGLRYVESSGALPPVPTRSNAEIAAEIVERLVAEGATTPDGILRDKFVRIAADVLRREGR